jgi:hypothetical protein
VGEGREVVRGTVEDRSIAVAVRAEAGRRQ